MDDSQSTKAGASAGKFHDWITQPFKEQMDAFQWVLFMGFAVVVVFAWTRILKHVIGE